MVFKIIISILFISLFISCEESTGFNEKRTNNDQIKLKVFNAKSISTQYTRPSLAKSSVESYIGYKKINDNSNTHRFNAITRSFYTFNFDTSYIKYDKGTLINRINDVTFNLIVSGGEDSSTFHKGFNHNVILRAVYADFTGENLYLSKNAYWSTNRLNPLPDDPAGSEALSNKVITNPKDSGNVRYAFSINKDKFNKFIDVGNKFTLKGFAIEPEFKEGFLKIDSLPIMTIKYKDTLTKNIKAGSSYIWNVYEDLLPGQDTDSEIFLLAANRRVNVIKFDTLEINNFTRKNIVLGGSFRFKYKKSFETPSLRMYQFASLGISSDPTRYNDKYSFQDFGIAEPLDLEIKKDIKSHNQIATKANSIAVILRDYLIKWQFNIANRQEGYIVLKEDQNKTPSLIEFPKYNEADSLYTLSVYYSPREED